MSCIRLIGVVHKEKTKSRENTHQKGISTAWQVRLAPHL
jgi:hypothetical protein